MRLIIPQGSKGTIRVPAGFAVEIVGHTAYHNTTHVRYKLVRSSDPKHRSTRDDFIDPELKLRVGYPLDSQFKLAPFPQRSLMAGEIFLLFLMSRYVLFSKELIRLEESYLKHVSILEEKLQRSIPSTSRSEPPQLLDLRARVDELRAMTANLMLQSHCSFTAHLVGPPDGPNPMMIFSIVYPDRAAQVILSHHS